MRNLTSSVSDWILAAACSLAACGGDTGQATLPISPAAGMSATAGGTPGTGSGSTAGTGSATGGSGSVLAGSGSAAAGSGGLAGRAAMAGSTGSAGRMGTAGTTVAGSAAAGSGAGQGGVGGIAGASVAGNGAGSGGSAGQAGGAATGATFTAVYKIFMINCSGATCHVGATRAGGGLSMADQMTAYMNLVGVNSSVCSGEKRVVASDAAKSELVYTLTRTQIGTCTRTPKMPDNKPMLAQADIDTVTAWIAAGAPND
jgi:hypothetical protein